LCPSVMLLYSYVLISALHFYYMLYFPVLCEVTTCPAAPGYSIHLPHLEQ
jgi:hypothetical protein